MSDVSEHVGGLSRSRRVTSQAKADTLDKIKGAKFWYTYERQYHLRKRKPRVGEILDLTDTIRKGFKVVDKTTKESRDATPEEIRKKLETVLSDYLYVANHKGGKTICHILLEPDTGLTILGEAICHPQLDAFNGKLGRKAARERAILNALDYLGVKDPLPAELRVPPQVQKMKRLQKSQNRYLRALNAAGFHEES